MALTDKDGNVYTTKAIGNQEWLVENLKVTQYADGTPIPLVTDPTDWSNLLSGAMCWHNNNIANKLVYGGLYNWFNTLTTNIITLGALYNWYAVDTGILAPEGWHVPTFSEYLNLCLELDPAGSANDNLAGGYMKEIGNNHWDSPNYAADNLSKFTAIGAGWRSEDGIFEYLKINTFFWNADEWSEFEAYSSFLAKDTGIFYTTQGNSTWSRSKNTGQSIRCIKDSTTLSVGQTSTVSDIDGNNYPTKCMPDGKEWMASNLKVEHYNDGTPIPNVTDNAAWAALTTGAMCYYDNDITLSELIPHDLVYLERNGVQETGWRIPTQSDFTTLASYLLGALVAGGKLKEAGTTHWLTPNTDADNSSGFTALGSSVRYDDGSFGTINEVAEFWTNGESDSDNAFLSVLSYLIAGLINDLASLKKIGASIRLVRDYNPIVPIIPQPPYQIGNKQDYRFYVSEASSITYEVFPLNFLSTTLVDELTNPAFYRRKFGGSLIFGTNSHAIDLECGIHNRCDDFDLFYAIEQSDPCARLYFDIHKIVNGTIIDYWHGYFSTTDGKWDLDRKTFEVTPLPNDDYALILENADQEYDILINTPEVTTNANDGTINQDYTHNHWLIDVITYIASQVAPGKTISSVFFTSATNPVTGLASKTNLVTIAQKSDIKRPTDPNPAHYPQGVLSWNELMDILWAMFQVTWNYDSLSDVINIEHISKFPLLPSGTIDIRTQLSCKATNKYSYIKESMPKYEKFSFMEANYTDFVGVPIRYESGCLNQDSKNNIKETSINVTTDLQYIWERTDAGDDATISDDGWVVLCNSGAGPIYSVVYSLGVLSLSTHLNVDFSWANLENDYYLHNRILIEGYINNNLTQFFSSQKTRQQECTVIFCAPFMPDDTITSELGEKYFDGEKGTIKQATLHPSGEVNLTLLYGTKNYNLTPPPAPSSWIRITMGSDCTHFDALLSDPAPIGGLSITFDFIVRGALPSRLDICYGVDTWVIPAGLTVASWDITLSCSIPSGGCVYYWSAEPDIGGWVVDFIYEEINCRCRG